PRRRLCGEGQPTLACFDCARTIGLPAAAWSEVPYKQQRRADPAPNLATRRGPGACGVATCRRECPSDRRGRSESHTRAGDFFHETFAYTCNLVFVAVPGGRDVPGRSRHAD